MRGDRGKKINVGCWEDTLMGGDESTRRVGVLWFGWMDGWMDG